MTPYKEFLDFKLYYFGDWREVEVVLHIVFWKPYIGLRVWMFSVDIGWSGESLYSFSLRETLKKAQAEEGE